MATVEAGQLQSPVVQDKRRGIWIIVMLLSAALIGGVAGLLAYAGGLAVPSAILTGGGAFASTMLLLIAIAYYIGGERT